MEANAKSCCCEKAKSIKTKRDRKVNVLNVITSIAFLLFPKCPICWAAYASVFSFIGFDHVEYNSTWRIWILLIFILGSVYLLYRHYLNNSWPNIIIYCSGIGIMFMIYYMNFEQRIWIYIAAFMMLLSNISFPSKVHLVE